MKKSGATLELRKAISEFPCHFDDLVKALDIILRYLEIVSEFNVYGRRRTHQYEELNWSLQALSISLREDV